jgi:hypothetical protein
MAAVTRVRLASSQAIFDAPTCHLTRVSMKILAEWLTQRVENAPIAEHRKLSGMAAMRIRMAWQKIKDAAEEGDEVWAFENPSNTWKKLGRHSGYALVRKGKIVQSTIVISA